MFKQLGSRGANLASYRPFMRGVASPHMSARHYSLVPPTDLDDYEKDIYKKLLDKLEPEELMVKDVSGGCGSMFAIQIMSKQFKGLSMIKQHRLVNEILADDIKQWHGIQLRTKAV